jgi:putative transposase
MAGYKSTAAALNGWICFEDEAGQSLRPPHGRTWGPRGITPIVKVRAGGGGKRVSVAGLIAFRPQHPDQVRYIYRTLLYHGRRHEPKGFDEDRYARLLDAAHQQLGGPIVLVWDNINNHKSVRMVELIEARKWLTVFRLPTYAPELNPVEGVWSAMKSGLVNLAKRDIDQLQNIIKNRLRRLQYRPTTLAGFLAKTGLDLSPLPTPEPKAL